MAGTGPLESWLGPTCLEAYVAEQSNFFQGTSGNRIPFHRVSTTRQCQQPRRLKRGLRPLGCWDRGFKSHQKHGCLSLVSVTFRQVDISATDRSLVQRVSTECGVSEWDLETSTTRTLDTLGTLAMWKQLTYPSHYTDRAIWRNYTSLRGMLVFDVSTVVWKHST